MPRIVRAAIFSRSSSAATAFTCDRAGRADIVYKANINYRKWLIAYYESSGDTDRYDPPVDHKARPVESGVVGCVMPEIVASAAPPFTTYTLSPEIPSATFFG